jgi:hypothetical protein
MDSPTRHEIVGFPHVKSNIPEGCEINILEFESETRTCYPSRLLEVSSDRVIIIGIHKDSNLQQNRYDLSLNYESS